MVSLSSFPNMQIKVLGLHGMGVNSEVFASQSAGFRSLLPSYYKFDFIDAEILCDPSPGASDYYTGPYLCWCPSPSTERVSAAHAALDRIIRERGPYDIIMGFSQGAALAASYLLHHDIENCAPPTQAAIFICSPLPFSKSVDHGLDCRAHFGVPTPESLTSTQRMEIPSYLIPESYFLRNNYPKDNFVKLEDKKVDLPRVDSGTSLTEDGRTVKGQETSSDGPYYNMFHPISDTVRLAVPTAHIYGAQDSWKRHGIDLLRLCSDATSFQHDGKHEIPSYASEEICDLIEELAMRAGLI